MKQISSSFKNNVSLQSFKNFWISPSHNLVIWLPSRCQYILIYHFWLLVSNHISFSASTNKTNLLIGRSKIRDVKFDLFSPITNFTPQKTLFSSLLISKIHPIGQLFRVESIWIKTIPLILKFLFSVVHFYLVGKVDRNSFLHLDQNSSAKFCTLAHCLLLCKSGLTNKPGGGIVTLLFIVNRLLGDSGGSFCGSLIVSTVRGQ